MYAYMHINVFLDLNNVSYTWYYEMGDDWWILIVLNFTTFSVLEIHEERMLWLPAIMLMTIIYSFTITILPHQHIIL